MGPGVATSSSCMWRQQECSAVLAISSRSPSPDIFFPQHHSWAGLRSTTTSRWALFLHHFSFFLCNHRIIEQLGFEGAARSITFQPLCHRQGCQLLYQVLDQTAQGPIQPGLNHLQRYPSTRSLATSPLSVKYFPLMACLISSLSYSPQALLCKRSDSSHQLWALYCFAMASVKINGSPKLQVC